MAFFLLCTIPILLKWTLIGRWKPQQIRIWSLAYVRFWFVKTLVQANPLVLFDGTPLYSLYLRALGAKVGPGVLIFSRHVPVCTDLVSIGDGSVIRKDSFITSYRAHSGVIHTDLITLGKNVLVGEMSGRRRRHLDGRRGPAGPRLLPARRPGRCPPASAGTARRPSPPT